MDALPTGRILAVFDKLLHSIFPIHLLIFNWKEVVKS